MLRKLLTRSTTARRRSSPCTRCRSRTAWWTDRAGQVEESFFSVVVNRDGLRFYIVQSWDDYRVEHALYSSHLWQRIGG
jgi:hypothetical protein